jgi:hypothetical protein
VPSSAGVLRLLSSDTNTPGTAEGQPGTPHCPTTRNGPDHLDSGGWRSSPSLRAPSCLNKSIGLGQDCKIVGLIPNQHALPPQLTCGCSIAQPAGSRFSRQCGDARATARSEDVLTRLCALRSVVETRPIRFPRMTIDHTRRSYATSAKRVRNDPLMLVERSLRTEPSCRQTLDFSSQAAF